MKRTTTLIMACLLSAAAAHAQTVDLQFAPQETKLIGPSPEAAAMTRYADTPVSYCLGQTGVTIPLYELKSRSITLPIYLSYDSSGVKVDAVSGPAGLNWTLMAGGVITRTVAGLPDEYMNGYRCVRPARQAYPFATEEGQMLSTDYEYLTYATQGNADREWDLYSYSFAGRSGSFYAVHEPGSYVYDIVPTSATPLTIRRLGTAGFTITDEDGTTWVFSLAETTSRTVSTASPGLNAGGPSAENTAQDITTVTAWYLSAAVPMDGKGTVTFTYDTLGTLYNERRSHSRTYSFTYRYLSPGSYQWMGPSGQWSGPPVAVQNMEASYVTETGWTPHVVKTVTWAGGHAVFDYTEDARDEIIGAVRNSYPSVLTSMRLYADGDTTAFRTVTFSVKGNRTGDGRNLLKDVTVRGRDGGVIESYSFDYKDENTSMAPNAKDLFGYWNSASSNQSTAFLRLFEDNYTITEHAADRGYNPSAVSALSLTGVTTASGSRTEFVYEGNSIPTGGASELFSVIGIGHRIRKIRTFDLSGSSGNGGNGGSTGTLVRERTFTYSGSGCTIPLTAFNRGSFSSVSEVFREDLVSGHPWWSGPTNPIPRTATVCLADQSMLPGAPLEGARIFHSTVTEKVCSPDGETVRTDYVFDCSGAVAQYGGGSWSLTQEHSDHDDNPLNNVLGSHLYHFFRRPPYRVPRTSGGPSVDFTPFMFHFTDRDRPEFGQPVEIRTYRTGEDGAETLVGRTVNTFGRAESDLQTGLAVKNLISQGDAQNMRGYRFCALDFFQQEVHRTLVHRRLRKSAVTSYLDDGTEKTTETVYTYGMGSRTSATDVTYYPVPVAPMETDSYPESGSVLSPRMETTVVDGDPSRVYSRYHIYPDELAAAGDGTDGYGWAASLLSKGYRRPVGEEILVGGGVTAGGTTFFGGTPVSKSGRYVTWDTFAPADGGDGSFLKPSVIRTWRMEAGDPAGYTDVGPTVSYTAYDRWGNPLEVQEQGQPVKTYLRSYEGLRPVAEIAGAGYAQVRSAVGAPTVDAMASAAAGPTEAQLSAVRSALEGACPAAQVSLYTHDLPFGTAMEEDVSGRRTSYGYDGAGRLSSVTDGDGNIKEGYLYELTRGGHGEPNRILSLVYTSAGAMTLPESAAEALSSSLTALPATRDVAYLDGLGRSVQSVSAGAATGGKDLVTPAVPDFLDREDARTYLPYPAGVTSSQTAGSFRTGALSAQQSHYTGLYGASEGARAFSENVYELSARNRTVASILPGSTDSTRVSTHGSPGGVLPVLSFDKATRTLTASGYHTAGRFTVTRTEGPDGSAAESWTDEFGTPVLERVRVSAADTSSGSPEEWAETRYVKDERGRVVCVMPPAEYAVLLSQAHAGGGAVASFGTAHCYTYSYDGRDRTVGRHLPDGVTETMTYNHADLLTSTVRTAADGTGTETFTTEYDVFNRPVRERYRRGAGNAVTLAGYAYDTVRDTLEAGGGVLTVPAFSDVTGIAASSDRDTRVKGLKTAELVRVLPAGESPSAMASDADAPFIVRSFHYDRKGNVIQTAESRPDVGATLRTSVKYGFAGNILLSREAVQSASSGGAVQDPARLDRTFLHDSRLRPTAETARLTVGASTGPFATLAFTYDDTGRQATLTRGSGTTEVTTYGYTIQGWLSSAAGDTFTETLRYGSPSRAATDPLPGKAGLITEWTFRQMGATATGGTTQAQTYAFSYDGAGRMTGSAMYPGGAPYPFTTLTENGITYDGNGNMLTMERYGNSSGTVVDSFNFSYTGTRRDGYTYDGHGNVTADPVNGTAISWNVIGLPRSVSAGADTAGRDYAADGTLLSVHEGTTGTAGMVHIGPMVYSRDADGTLSLENAAWEGGCILPGTGSDRVLYRITDHLGSVRAVRDGTGKVLQRFDYYPSGSESRVWTAGTSTTQSALQHRFGGKEIAGGKAGTAVHPLSKAASAGRPYLDFGARLYDPRTAAWLSQDPMAEKYYAVSPYSYCAGNPVNLVDPEGLSLAWVPRVNPATGDLLGFDWVDDEMIALDDGSLPEGVYHQAIFFTDNGSFDSHDNYNIGSSTAVVYLANGDITTFKACTYPSDVDRYPTVPEGGYEALVGEHWGSSSHYTALKMFDVGKSLNNNTINLGFENPAYNDGRTSAKGIDIHKAGNDKLTGIDSKGLPISAGCLLIMKDNWEKFFGLFNNDSQRGNKVGVIVSRTHASPSFPNYDPNMMFKYGR